MFCFLALLKFADIALFAFPTVLSLEIHATLYPPPLIYRSLALENLRTTAPTVPSLKLADTAGLDRDDRVGGRSPILHDVRKLIPKGVVDVIGHDSFYQVTGWSGALGFSQV